MTREAQEQRDDKAYAKGYEAAFGHTDPVPGTTGTYVIDEDGQPVNMNDLEVERALKLMAQFRKNDATNIVSVASAVLPRQAAEANRRFGDLGVRFDPKTGKPHYRDRRAKLRVLKARNIHDNDEVCG